MSSALRQGQETNNLLGGIALMFSLLLWATSQPPVRRAWYNIYKFCHHVGFWGFMLLGVAHHWALFWYFVPGMLLYAVDGVFRLHQMFTGRGGDLASPGGTSGDQGSSWVNAEVLQVEVDSAGTMCSLLLAAPGFGIAPVGVVWLNVPQLSWVQWHAFDYTACEVSLDEKGRVVKAGAGDKGTAGGRRVTAMAVHIKAYRRWEAMRLLPSCGVVGMWWRPHPMHSVLSASATACGRHVPLYLFGCVCVSESGLILP